MRSDPSSWPRSSSGESIWGEVAGALLAPLPPAGPRYEPLIVTTLRRYSRRGASIGLLQRLAGGAGHWRTVNATWDIDGRTQAAAVVLRERLEREAIEDAADAGTAFRIESIGVALCPQERRIALVQIVADYARGGRPPPTTTALAAWLGVTEGTVRDDVDWLRVEGAIAASLVRRASGRPQRVRLAEAAA